MCLRCLADAISNGEFDQVLRKPKPAAHEEQSSTPLAVDPNN